MSKLKGARLENEVDKCRAENNWSKLHELLRSVQSKGSGLENLANFLHGEYLLENFSEEQLGQNVNTDLFTSEHSINPDPKNREKLKKAEHLLLSVFDSNDLKPGTALEANLLLAKMYFWSADFDKAVDCVNKARLERDDIQFNTLRTLKLVAEAYAIKGLSIERQPSQSTSRYQRQVKETLIMACFEKAAELALAYIQELEKSCTVVVNREAAVALNVSSGGARLSGDRVGSLMETSIQKVPLIYIKNHMIDKGVEQYRKVLTVSDKSVSQRLHQRLSRQLAEVILRGVPENSYSSPNSSPAAGSKAQQLKFYMGADRAYCPQSRMEEVLLILSISEAIAAREAVLSRAEEHNSAREQSLADVKAVHNLLTLVLSSLRQYQLMAGILEKSLKFAYQDRFIWFQFALSLMSSGRYRRASLVLKECVHNEHTSPTPNPVTFMLAAKLAIENLGQYDLGVEYAEQAVKYCQGGWLDSRCKLLLGLAMSLKSQTSSSWGERKALHGDALSMLHEAARSDPKDYLARFFVALQYAIGRQYVESRENVAISLELNDEQPAAIMLMALLVTQDHQHEEALKIVEEGMQQFPTHYGLSVLRLKLEMHLGKCEDALITAKDLLMFWRSLLRKSDHMTSPSNLNDRVYSSCGTRQGSAQYGNTNLKTPAPGLMPSASAIDITDKESMFGGAGGPMSEAGAASTISLGLTATSSYTHANHAFGLQANIWLELAELYLDAGRISDVHMCVDEACHMFPNSHQTLYLKGRLLLYIAQNVKNKSVEDEQEEMKIMEQFLNRVKEAKSCFLGSLAVVPCHLSSLRHLAESYELEGNLRMSEKVLRQLIKIDPTDHHCWKALGNCMSQQGRFDDSTKCFETASSLEDTAPILPFHVIPRVINLS